MAVIHIALHKHNSKEYTQKDKVTYGISNKLSISFNMICGNKKRLFFLLRAQKNQLGCS